MNKSTRNILWSSWRIDAARHFNISVGAIHKRWKNADPDLINWIESELINRRKRQEEAQIKKRQLLAGDIDAILKSN